MWKILHPCSAVYNLSLQPTQNYSLYSQNEGSHVSQFSFFSFETGPVQSNFGIWLQSQTVLMCLHPHGAKTGGAVDRGRPGQVNSELE